MRNDIFIEKFKSILSKKIKKDNELKELFKKGNKTHEDGFKYAKKISSLLTDAIDKCTEQKLGIDRDILKKILEDEHSIITKFTSIIQEEINEREGIGLKSAIPEISSRDVNWILALLEDNELIEENKIKKSTFYTFGHRVVDNHIKENANLHHKIGLKPVIIRKASAKACEFCLSLEGVFLYPDEVPEGIFKRHEDCDCIVIYKPNKLRRKLENVWTKRKY